MKNAAFGYDRVTLSAVKRLLSQSQVIFTKLECDKLVAVIFLPLIFCGDEFFFDFLLNPSISLVSVLIFLSGLFKQNLSHGRFTLCYNSRRFFVADVIVMNGYGAQSNVATSSFSSCVNISTCYYGTHSLRQKGQSSLRSVNGP